MLVSDQAIVATKEAAFVAVGRAALGNFGRWAAIVGAVFATGSAINATLFSTARLVRDAERLRRAATVAGPRDQRAPHRRHDLSSSIVGARDGDAARHHRGDRLRLRLVPRRVRDRQLPGQARTAPRRSERVTAWLAAGACTAAFADLVVELARHDRPGLLVLVGLVLAIATGRIIYARRHPVPVEPPA